MMDALHAALRPLRRTSTHTTALLVRNESTGRSVRPRKGGKRRMRFANDEMRHFFSPRADPGLISSVLRKLEKADPVEVMAKTDQRVWSIALQNRFRQKDGKNAEWLVEYLFASEPSSGGIQLWTDMLFTTVRQGGASSNRYLNSMLDRLKAHAGPEVLSSILINLLNGCSKLGDVPSTTFLLDFYLSNVGKSTGMHKLPPKIASSVLYHLYAQDKHEGVVQVFRKLHDHPTFDTRHHESFAFVSLFRSCAKLELPYAQSILPLFLDWATRAQHKHSRSDASYLTSTYASALQYFSRQSPRDALRVYSHLSSLRDETPDVRMDENMYVSALVACRELQDWRQWKEIYRRMIHDGCAKDAGYGLAIAYCRQTHDTTMLEHVLDELSLTEQRFPNWHLPRLVFNDALRCYADARDAEGAKELFQHMLSRGVEPDAVTMLAMVDSHRNESISQLMALLHDFLDFDVSPTLEVFTSLQAACSHRRSTEDMQVLFQSMLSRSELELDVQAFTPAAVLYGATGDVHGILKVLEEMRARDLSPDHAFATSTMQALYTSEGIEVCFSFMQLVPRLDKQLYSALIDVGLLARLPLRTLAVAYNMECEGIPISSDHMLKLIEVCETKSEVVELVKTFTLLHEDGGSLPKYASEVYVAMEKVVQDAKMTSILPRLRRYAVGKREQVDKEESRIE